MAPTPTQQIVDAIKDGNNVFISGVGGCGKTYMLKQLQEIIGKTRPTVLTSTTGISAYNLGGITLHSFFRLILPQIDSDKVQQWAQDFLRKLRRKQKVVKRIKLVEVLFIDEVSMLGSNYLDLLNYVCQEIRGNYKPMGGIQLVLGGDMMQLAPVRDDYPFESVTWPTLNLKYFCLTKAWRFDNQRWVDLLHRSRVGKLTDDDVQLLKSRLNDVAERSLIVPPIILCSRNDMVEDINRKRLDELPGETYIFPCNDYEAFKNEEDEVDKLNPLVFDDEIDKLFVIDKSVVLKKGCQVMLLANLNVAEGLTNGTLGIVQHIDTVNKTITVLFENKVHVLTPHQFVVDHKDKSYARVAFPLKLAFATSIHKSQSLTLSSVEVDIGSNVFCEGQSYVALSRCRSLEGLFLRALDVSKIKPNKKAAKFEEGFFKTCVAL